MSKWNGLLLIDKPGGCTSHDVVDRVRRILRQKEIGHAGTLDPLASGLMVLLLGQATKLSNYILAQDKRYRVKVRLGVTTDSADRDGEILSTSPVDVSRDRLAGVMGELTGDLELEVPMISAVKVQGKKLYEYARENKPVVAPRKMMKFFDLNFLGLDGAMADAEISCSKGGYIRAWTTELGRRLGVGGTVEELRRLASYPYDVHEAVTLEKLTDLAEAPDPVRALGPAYIPMSQALPGWVTCLVRGREEQLLRHGQISHDLTNRLIVAQKDAFQSQKAVGIKVLSTQGDLVGLLEAVPNQGLKIRRIFPAGQGLDVGGQPH
jgi:tRNA pseudouridine55 synthase